MFFYALKFGPVVKIFISISNIVLYFSKKKVQLPKPPFRFNRFKVINRDFLVFKYGKEISCKLIFYCDYFLYINI